MHDALQLLRVPGLAAFTADAFPLDLAGWGSDAPIFSELIAEVRPRLIIEVGSWKGASAIHMAGVCTTLGLDARIVCVDTWLGSLEFWTDPEDRTRYGALDHLFGYPRVFYQFLANVVQTGHADRILPFPQTSQIAARWFAGHGVQADLIYLDGSHDEGDVAADIRAYLPLVRPGGVLFGDDWGFNYGAVARAVMASGHAHTVQGGRYWRIDR